MIEILWDSEFLRWIHMQEDERKICKMCIWTFKYSQLANYCIWLIMPNYQVNGNTVYFVFVFLSQFQISLLLSPTFCFFLTQPQERTNLHLKQYTREKVWFKSFVSWIKKLNDWIFCLLQVASIIQKFSFTLEFCRLSGLGFRI